MCAPGIWKKNMNLNLKLIALSCALIFSTSSFAAENMSLAQSVERAVLSNPELGARFQDFQSSLEGQKVARGALLPEINAQAWTGKEWQGSASNRASSNWTRRGYTVELRQLVFNGFKTVNQVKQLGLEKLSAYYELMATVDNLAFEAAKAHIDVQRYREMEALARENYDMHLSILRQIEDRQVSGIGRGVDLEQAYGRQALAQSNLMTESGSLNDVLQRYHRIVGVPAPAILFDAPSVEDSLPVTIGPFDKELRRSPSILSKQALVQAANAGKNVARGNLSPTLELKAATGRDKNPNPNNPDYRDAQSSSVQLVASYNLYRGGADSARIRQTIAQEYAARDVRDYTCRNMQQELNVAWNGIQRLRSQIPFLQQHEMATSKVRVAYMQQFHIGQRSLLDLLDTENELFDARRALSNAQYDLQQAELHWLALANKILPAVGLAQPYDEHLPKEADGIEFPEETFQACMTPLPDLTNLKPMDVQYGRNLTPPHLTYSN